MKLQRWKRAARPLCVAHCQCGVCVRRPLAAPKWRAFRSMQQPPQPSVGRAEDLTNMCFDDPSYPLTSETWRDWLSRSAFDAGATMTLDTTLTEEPYLFVFKNGTRGAVYAVNQVAYQAPTIQRVALGRLNNSAFYLSAAIKLMDAHAKEEQLKRDREDNANDIGDAPFGAGGGGDAIAGGANKKRGVDVRLDALMESLLASGSLQKP